MNMSNQEYGKYVSGKAKPSPLWKDCLWAFCVGGLICIIGQGLRNAYQGAGLNQEDAGTLVSVTLIFLSALLPITGFANAMVAPALEFKSEGLVLGTGARLFTVAGPVLVYGISASVIYGVVLWIVSLF